MNIFNYLFPVRPEEGEEVGYVFVGVSDDKKHLYIVKIGYGHLLKGMKGHIEKMRKEHIALLKDDILNEIIFTDQLALF